MSTRLGPATVYPRITLDPSPQEHAIAVWLDGKGITTPEGWAAWLAAADPDDMLEYSKMMAAAELTVEAPVPE